MAVQQVEMVLLTTIGVVAVALVAGQIQAGLGLQAVMVLLGAAVAVAVVEERLLVETVATAALVTAL